MGFFESLRNDYENAMDDLEEKGVPQPRIIVPAVLLLLLALAAVYGLQTLQPPAASAVDLTVQVLDASGVPLQGAMVKLSSAYGDALANKNTGSDGTAFFKGAPKDAEISVAAQGFEGAQDYVTGRGNVRITLAAKELPPASRIMLAVLDDKRQPVPGASVTLTAADGKSVALFSTTNAVGVTEATVNKLPNGALVTASKEGYETISPVLLTLDQLAATQNAPFAITLTPTQQPLKKYATVQVEVTEQNGAAVDGVAVALLNPQTGGVIDEMQSEYGTAVFEKVEFGRKFTIRVKAAAKTFGEYLSEEQSANREFATISVVLERARKDSGAATATITVFDYDNQPVEDATVSVFDKATNTPVESEAATDYQGKLEVALAPSKSYYATAHAAGLLPAFANVKSGDSVKLVLQEANDRNSYAARIFVTEGNAPSAGASVALYTRGLTARDGAFLGTPIAATGADGLQELRIPQKIDGKQYAVEARASKGAKTGVESGLAKEGLSLNISITAPKAIVIVNATDKTNGRRLAGVTMRLSRQDNSTACTTALNGSCTASVESGEQYTAEFTAPGYLKLTISNIRLQPLETRTLNAELYSTAALSAANAEFLGFYDALGNRLTELENAQSYKARFRLDAPSSTLAGFYLRVGKATTAADDYAFIKAFNDAGAPYAYWGGAHAFAGCESGVNASLYQDALGGNETAAKWVEWVFSNGLSGSREFEAIVRIADNAEPGATVEVAYRAYAVSRNLPLSSPADADRLSQLLGRQSFAPADFCAAAEKKASVKIARNLLSCGQDGLCSRITLSNPDAGTRHTNGLPVELGKHLDLQYTLYHPEGISNVEVSTQFFDVVSSESNTTEVILSPQRKISLAAEGTALPVSTESNEKADGTVKMLARKPATKALVELSITIPGRDAPIKKTAYARITGTNSFESVAASASQLTLNTETTLVITLRDAIGKPVTDASVSLAACSGQPIAGEAKTVAGDGSRGKGRNGEYSFRIKPSGMGVLGVRVEHKDFSEFDSCETGDEPLIDVQPGEFLAIEPEQLAFEGTFTTPASQVLLVRTTAPVRSFVSTAAYCGLQPAAMLQLGKTSFTLQDQQQVTVTLTQPAVAECEIIFTAVASPGVSSTVSVPVSLHSPAPIPSPTPPYPPITSMAVLPVDEEGFSQGFYNLASLGSVTGCRFTPSGLNPLPEGSVTASCANGFASLQAAFDLEDPQLCFTNDPLTGRLTISRTVNGYPAPDAVVAVSARPTQELVAAKPCATPTPTPTPTPSGCPPIATCAPGYNAGQSQAANGCAVVTCTLPPSHCTNNVKDSGEQDVDCGGSCAACPDANAPLPASVRLDLDTVARAEAYYSLAAIDGEVTGCEIASLDATATSPTNFVSIDSAACAAGTLAITADYAAFPHPPGLYRNLLQTATIRITRQGAAAETRPLAITARNIPGIPLDAPSCGDGQCQAGETSVACASDCPNLAHCTNGLRDSDEVNVDCGGSCAACSPASYCGNARQDPGERAVDCGGECNACTPTQLCTNGMLDGDNTEDATDCGGTYCTACPITYPNIPSSIRLELDETGLAEAYYSLANIPGQATGCELSTLDTSDASPANFITTDCTNGVAHITADYAAFPNPPGLYRNLKQKATLRIARNGQTPANRQIIITAEGVEGAPFDAPRCGDRSCNEGLETAETCPLDCALSHCANGVKDEDEDAVDCGGAECSACQTALPPLPSSIRLELDQTAFAEAYYSVPSGGKPTGCEIASLDNTATSMKQFTAVDASACAAGVVHIIADYTAFPTPPGLYKSLTHTGTLRIARQGQAAATATVTVVARNVPGIPLDAPRCGDKVCTQNAEDEYTCPQDCVKPSCNDGLQNGLEEGVDCGGSCARKCTSYPDIPGTVVLKLNNEATATATYSLKNAVGNNCEISFCEVKSPYSPLQDPALQASNFVTVDDAACRTGTARLTADYSAYPNLYRNYRGGAALYATCTDGSIHTRIITVTAENMASLPADAPSCSDGAQNQGEQAIDCGGPCTACPVPPSCTDGFKNGGELGIDCGGSCAKECIENLYLPLPAEIKLTLGEDAFAEAYYHTNLISAKSVECTGITSPFKETDYPEEDITNFVTVTCEGGVAHVTADYRNHPELWRGLVQGGSFTARPSDKPTAVKTVRVIVSAAGVTGAPYARTASGIDSLPARISLVVASYQTGFTAGGGYGGLGITTPNAKTFAINFKNPPSCEPEGLQYAGAGLDAYGGYGRAGLGMPQTFAQTALSPQSYWPGGGLQNTPQIIYPNGYPYECQVPQVLHAPWLCASCRDFFPDQDWAVPTQRQQYSQGSQSLFGRGSNFGQGYPAQSFNQFGNALQPQYGFPQARGSFNTPAAFSYNDNFLSPYPASQFGNQPYGYPSGYASPYSGMGTQSQYWQGQPSGIGMNVPQSCLAPAVCGNPQACSLYYCKAQVLGGGYGIAQGGLQTSLTPRVEACTNTQLTISANYLGAAPQSAFVQQNGITVTETLANGKTRTKTIPVTIIVLADQANAAGQSSQQVLYCSQGIASQRSQNEQLVHIRQANAGDYGLPKEIVVKLNPASKKGEAHFKVAVAEPNGDSPTFLCDSSELKKLRNGNVLVEREICDSDGNIDLKFDYSKESGLTPTARNQVDSSTLTVRINILGPAKARVPVKIVWDDFTPAAVPLVFWKKISNNYAQQAAASGDEEDSAERENLAELGSIIIVKDRKLAPGSLEFTLASAAPATALATDSSLSFAGTRLASSKNIAAATGEVTLRSANEMKKLHVASLLAPTQAIVKLKEVNGEETGAFVHYWLGKGNSLPQGLTATCELAAPSEEDEWMALAGEENAAGEILASEGDDNTAGKFAAKCDAGKLSITANGVTLEEQDIKLAVLRVKVGGDDYALRELTIPIHLLGKDVPTLAERKEKEKLVLSARTTNGNDEARAESPSAATPPIIVFIGEEIHITVSFPLGDDAAKRKLTVTSTKAGYALSKKLTAKSLELTRAAIAVGNAPLEESVRGFTSAGEYAIAAQAALGKATLKASVKIVVNEPDKITITPEKSSFEQGDPVMLKVSWPEDTEEHAVTITSANKAIKDRELANDGNDNFALTPPEQLASGSYKATATATFNGVKLSSETTFTITEKRGGTTTTVGAQNPLAPPLTPPPAGLPDGTPPVTPPPARARDTKGGATVSEWTAMPDNSEASGKFKSGKGTWKFSESGAEPKANGASLAVRYGFVSAMLKPFSSCVVESCWVNGKNGQMEAYPGTNLPWRAFSIKIPDSALGSSIVIEQMNADDAIISKSTAINIAKEKNGKYLAIITNTKAAAIKILDGDGKPLTARTIKQTAYNPLADCASKIKLNANDDYSYPQPFELAKPLCFETQYFVFKLQLMDSKLKTATAIVKTEQYVTPDRVDYVGASTQIRTYYKNGNSPTEINAPTNQVMEFVDNPAEYADHTSTNTIFASYPSVTPAPYVKINFIIRGFDTRPFKIGAAIVEENTGSLTRNPPSRMRPRTDTLTRKIVHAAQTSRSISASQWNPTLFYKDQTKRPVEVNLMLWNNGANPPVFDAWLNWGLAHNYKRNTPFAKFSVSLNGAETRCNEWLFSKGDVRICAVNGKTVYVRLESADKNGATIMVSLNSLQHATGSNTK